MDIKLKENIGEHNVIEVEIFYDLGGINYWRGGSDKRGFYLRVKGVTRHYERGFTSTSFTMFATDDKDFKYLLTELKRNNKKKLAKLNEALAENLDTETLVTFYAAGDKRGMIILALEALAAAGLATETDKGYRIAA